MHKKQSGLKLLIVSAIVIFTACLSVEKSGSGLSNTLKGNRLLPAAVNRIYIDKIYDGNISASVKDSFASALRSKINLNKKLSLIDTPENSDLILKIKLTGFVSENVKYNSMGIVELKKLRLDSFVWLVSAATGEWKIKEKKVESELFYSDINSPIMSELKAITVLTDQLADRIISVITTGWYLEK
jgi:hypothetical protein